MTSPLILLDDGAVSFAQSALQAERDALADDLDRKIAHLREILRGMDALIVGFSAGVDSTFLLKVAVDELGERCTALTAVSPSLPARERAEAQRIAASLGARHLLRESDEIHNPKYRANPTDRCFHCKTALFDLADQLKAEAQGRAEVAIGTNTDDLNDHRPGFRAAQERGVRHPLVEAAFSKKDVREASRRLGLDVWDKAEFACLSSRFPYGTEITAERLARVETCEDVLHDLGFRVFRVRYHGEVVRIELGEDEVERALSPEIRPTILSRCKAAGFKYITLDMQGYRRGSMNE